MDIKMTKHAMDRAQQRAIRRDVITMILSVAREIHCGSGCVKLIIGNRECEQAKAIFGDSREIRKILEKARGTYIVEGQDGSLVTVARRIKRTKVDCKYFRSNPSLPMTNCSIRSAWKRGTSHEVRY